MIRTYWPLLWLIAHLIIPAFLALLGVVFWLVYTKRAKIAIRRRRWIVGLVLLIVTVPVLTQSNYMLLTEPLWEAANTGSVENVRLLLDAGARVNAIHDDGTGTPLMAAAYAGHKDVVRLLLSRGADVNQEVDFTFNQVGFNHPDNRQTALDVANGKPEIVAMLRAAGAKPGLSANLH